MKVLVRFSGRGYDLAENLPNDLVLSEGATTSDAIALLNSYLPDHQPLPASCLIAISGAHIGAVGSHTPQPLSDGDQLALIAPVAGG